MIENRKKKESGSKRKIISSVIILIIIFSSAFLAYFILQLVFNTQYPVVIVISDSMKPSINRGDLLFVRGIDPEDIKNGTIADKEGDVVVFDARGLWGDAPEEPIVHRIVAKWYNETTQKWYFFTKGDANFHIDFAIIPEDRIYGVVIGGIPYIGYLKIFLIDTGLYIILIILLTAILVISMIRDFKKEEDRNEKANNSLNNSNINNDETLINPDYNK